MAQNIWFSFIQGKNKGSNNTGLIIHLDWPLKNLSKCSTNYKKYFEDERVWDWLGDIFGSSHCPSR